ncbi:MAG: prepilin-type N-terminal cleavage/methylation domain-containing protein [Actinomycetota bacterium]
MEVEERSACARRRDAGFTLSEVLVAVALLGVSVVTIIGGVRAVVTASATSDEQAKVEAVLVSASDRLRAAEYIPCPDLDGDYGALTAAAASTVGWNADRVDVVRIQYWDPTAGSPPGADAIDADGDWSPTNSLSSPTGCQTDIGLTTARTLQKLTIRVTSPDGSLARSIDVVKSPIIPDPDHDEVTP